MTGPVVQMSPVRGRTMRHMGNARHKRKYPEGQRIQMTPAWKQRVRDRLSENKRNGIEPMDQVQLAAAIGGVDKSAVTKMLNPKTTSSKLVPEVCRVLLVDQQTRDAMAALLREIRTKNPPAR